MIKLDINDKFFSEILFNQNLITFLLTEPPFISVTVIK
jgi:hypothetical protein